MFACHFLNFAFSAHRDNRQNVYRYQAAATALRTLLEILEARVIQEEQSALDHIFAMSGLNYLNR